MLSKKAKLSYDQTSRDSNGRSFLQLQPFIIRYFFLGAVENLESDAEKFTDDKSELSHQFGPTRATGLE